MVDNQYKRGVEEMVGVTLIFLHNLEYVEEQSYFGPK